MATPTTERPKRNWRHRESRQKDKALIKRVSPADHTLVSWYMKQINGSVSEKLDPAVQALIAEAREHLMARQQAGDPDAANIAQVLAESA